ncbi:hypothetical protein [Rhizobium sp. PAMB 3182]
MVKQLPKSIPATALALLKFIYSKEAPKGHDTIFGNRQGHLDKPLTTMTVGDVIEQQKLWSSKSWVKKNWGYGTASSAAGAPQFMRDTLISLAKDYGFSGTRIFNPGFQDTLAYCLLLRRKFDDFISGRISTTRFGLELAKEWASFPVLADCQGAHRPVRRGQSYYNGDGLNKALVSPGEVEKVLEEILAMRSRKEETGAAAAPVPTGPGDPGQRAPLDHEPAAPKVPEKIAAEKLDKPIVKSKTVWMWLTTIFASSGSVFAAFAGMDWRAQLPMMAIVTAFGIYAIRRRKALAELFRELKED